MWSTILFCLELYHFVTHVLVLFGIRMLPRKDLVKQRIYFLIDLVCASLSFAIHRKFLSLIILQNIQHAFYFLTWEKSWLAKRVVSWSSLDWDRDRWIQVDLVLGTFFDVAIHAMNVILLFPYVPSTGVLVLGLMVDLILILVVIFNPKFAWANPSHIPSWIRRRLKPLSADERQEIMPIERINTQLFKSANSK